MIFRCSAIVGVQPVAEAWCGSESEALAWRDDQFGPRVDQVTIVVNLYGDRWAIRHLSHDGCDSDSGWRLWEGARFLGVGELTDFDSVVEQSEVAA